MICKKCKKIIEKRRGYPMINGKEYCDRCFYIIRWKGRSKREEEKRCNKR